ncbi:putative fad dependent oxidoreductase [Moniliophthora roreri MCA 2997]|uniref:Fad dependent oxidoreductase n=1 Tax=Moniliophthora roreri (strain MCA 2997) TaxID=1381753 RepID=V2X8L3_MONRO|nr:putative fad dependent oxidoreductase [Moniliophthora roreri MCA 2997]
MKSHLLVSFILLLSARFGLTYGTPTTACNVLQAALPDRVFFPGSDEYTEDNEHFYGSSSEVSTCTVQPESAADVGIILQVVANSTTQSPFAIKSGGHGVARGFSSTPGVQISLSRFNDIAYDATASKVKIGAGLTWDQVYTLLEPFNVKVMGGRVPGVGVGGLLLGGGFGYFTDQYGLGVDNIVSLDLVLPDGTFTVVSEASDPDLFFALKGGFNNFGIVIAFTMKAYPQTDVWAANVIHPINSTSTVHQAIADWSATNDDLKGVVIPLYAHVGGQTLLVTSLFYDAPMQPSIFDDFINVPGATMQVSGVMSLAQVGEALFGGLVGNPNRGSKHTVPITHYTVAILDEIKSQFEKIVSDAQTNDRPFIIVNIVVEPFVQPFAHSTDSAYPHLPERSVCPTMLEINWYNATDDAYFLNALEEAQQAIQAVAIAEGQSFADDILYNNYAPADTPLELLYGDNLKRLKEVKERVDPGNIMGLTGGFKF